MSTASKVTLGVSVAFTIGMISYVHLWQKKERARMREGVVMDIERQLRKRSAQEEGEQLSAQSGSQLSQGQNPAPR